MIVMKENKDERINKALKLYFNNKEGLKTIGECIFGNKSNRQHDGIW